MKKRQGPSVTSITASLVEIKISCNDKEGDHNSKSRVLPYLQCTPERDNRIKKKYSGDSFCTARGRVLLFRIAAFNDASRLPSLKLKSKQMQCKEFVIKRVGFGDLIGASLKKIEFHN